MPELKNIPSQCIDDVLQALDADGACIALDVLSPGVCRALLNDFRPHLDAVAWGADDLGYRKDFYGEHTKRLHGLFSKSSHMVDVLLHPLFVTLARAMFVKPGIAADIRLSNAELMVIGQNQPAQMMHTDAASWARAQKICEHEILVSANCALTDFRATNGATRVVPGSHKWAQDREPQSAEICVAEMPRGAALIYNGNVLHSGGSNQESAPRAGLYLGYIVSWLRPLENQLITNRAEDLWKLPVEARQLLDVTADGFTVYA